MLFLVSLLSVIAAPVCASKIAFSPGRSLQSWAIASYCSCDASGCALYEQPNRIKDLYCELHGCTHLLYHFKPEVATPPKGVKSLFKEHKIYNLTSVTAMWAPIRALVLALEDPRKFEWVFLMGGDQVILDLSFYLHDLLPKVVYKDPRYDVFIPVKKIIDKYGLMSPPIIRNTPEGRAFVQEWWAYSYQGNYIVEDQSVLNMCILKALTEDRSIPKEFHRNEVCTPYVDEPAYDILKTNRSFYFKTLRRWSSCNEHELLELYGPRPFSSISRGRKVSNIALFEIFNETTGACVLKKDECGVNWNAGFGSSNVSFISHLAGFRKGLRVKRAMNVFFRRNNVSSLTKKSAAYDICVTPLENLNVT